MRTWKWAAAAAAVTVAVVAVPVVAGHTFSDVPDTSVFHDDVQWLADTGVTKGCNPPANDLFCPKDKVSREQMAAFLHRFSDLVPGVALVELADKDLIVAALTDIGSVTITAPNTGYIVVTATGWTDGTTTDDTLLSVGLNVSDSASGLDLTGPDGILIHGSSSFFPDPNELAPYEFRYPFAVTRMFPIETAGTYTYHLFAEAVIEDDGDTVDELNMTVSVPVLQATYYFQAYGEVPAAG